MALIRRGDLNRPLTIEEIDGNFDYLESISGGSGATPSLDDVVNIGNYTLSYISASQGFVTLTPYTNMTIGGEYIGGSGKIYFVTRGDGFEFPSTNTLTINANIEEWFFVNTTAINYNTFLIVSPSQVLLSNSGESYNHFTSLDNFGFGISTTASLTSYIKADALTSNRTYQLPDKDGELALANKTLAIIITTDNLGGVAYSVANNDFDFTINSLYRDDIGTLIIDNIGDFSIFTEGKTITNITKDEVGQVDIKLERDLDIMVILNRNSSGSPLDQNCNIFLEIKVFN